MQALQNIALATAVALIGAMPAFAGDDKSKGHIDLLSHGWAVPRDGNAAPATGDGGYVLTDVQHSARQGTSGLNSLNGLGSSRDLFANNRGGDQGAQGPSGTGKTLSAELLGKDTSSPAPAMGDGSVRFLSNGIQPADAESGAPVRDPCCRGSFTFTVTATGNGASPTLANNPGGTAKPGSGVPTGTVTFIVDGVSSSAGGPPKGAMLGRK